MAADEGPERTSTPPPYQLIAGALRERIAAGQLGPGDRVPSARQITREWGVAIATATKALALLRQEGLTVAQPGSGTVVARPARRTVRREPVTGLSLPAVVRAATAVADADGLAELTMRRLAGGLGVATMSLYRYVPNRAVLITAMIDAAFGEQRLPAVPPAGWRERLTVVAGLQWQLFRRHPWLAPAMSLTRPQFAPNAVAHVEWVLSAFDGTGVRAEDRMYAHITLFSFIRGVASALEPEELARRDTGMDGDAWMTGHQPAPRSRAAPRFQEFVDRDEFELDLDRLFRFGLERLLDGFAGLSGDCRDRAG
ncbi:TetR/AcrR family transcriptional regulator C-terminal domain-containing protein [Actinoplanes sp. N902-109]|uniref:TetR/AcrR family transcriptional regulator C-terminal domain-containing protein n=1 Tax=Actinoplanes sp. (strain N902-109) TaxID=649831 RepID=UPI0003294547|nr:TetR/AcrR family transcriptional regulator C-terminal domain-containing protein [Actinoplanes sp. N902-109]AGL18189.1 GntR family transcriptional regulator [Actinoplanes sp. N902-109]